MDTEEKVRENYYRRMAKRLGVCLQKSRGNHWSVDNKLGYRILDPYRNNIVQGQRWDMTLDGVAQFLEDYEKILKGEQPD